MSIRENYDSVHESAQKAAVSAGRNPDDIRLLAVSKTYGADTVQDAIDSGIFLFGENKVQEARDKIPLLHGSFDFHLIGHLQSNKAKDAVKLFSTIHSLDKISTAEKLDIEAFKINKTIDVFVQVNTSGEDSKSGVEVELAEELCSQIMLAGNLKLTGLMTIGPAGGNIQDAVKSFVTLRNLKEKINSSLSINMTELSMGMSGDYIEAIKEGSTVIRVGSAIFGKRDYTNG